MVKLVISDMDGTLIDRDEVLPKKAVEMAHALREKVFFYNCNRTCRMYGRKICSGVGYTDSIYRM